MKLEYRDRLMEYAADGSRLRLKVILGNDDGAIYPVYLPADVASLNNQDLLEMALESVYQLNFPMRAENEKFNEYDGLIKEIKKVSEKVDETTKVVSSTTLEIGNMVYDHEDILNQLLERMGLKVDENGVLVTNENMEVEGGE